jgi:hypothetical protein
MPLPRSAPKSLRLHIRSFFERRISLPLPAAIATSAGAGIGLMSSMASAYFPNAPLAIFGLVFWVGVILFLCPLPTWALWVLFNQRLRLGALKAILACTGVWVALLVFFWFFVGSTLARWEVTPQPELTLCFIGYDRPTLVVLNVSDQVAENIVWQTVLFDLDSPTPDNTLQIPGQKLEYLKPATKLSNGAVMEDLFSFTVGPQVVKSGDRIVGSAAASCPKCLHEKTFLLSIILGSGGWYSQSAEDTSGGLILPPDGKAMTMYKMLQSLPTVSRIEIPPTVGILRNCAKK